MSTREIVLQACRAWFKSAGGLTDAQVIVSDDKGPRPTLPYLTVKILAFDIPVGVDEDLPALADTLEVTSGTTGTVYAVTVNGTVVSYTRTVGQTHAQAAASVQALIDVIDGVYASVSSATITVSAITSEITITSVSNLTHTANLTPVYGVGGARSATVSVQGHGTGSSTWLEDIAMRSRIPVIQDALDVAGLSVRALGGMTDIAALIDTEIEPRFLREFEITYEMRARPATAIAADYAEVVVTLEDVESDASPYTVTITVDAG